MFSNLPQLHPHSSPSFLTTDQSLNAWQLDLLKELFPQVASGGNSYYSSSSTTPPPLISGKHEHYYKLRFEAAEQRYDRMKGLTRAALEKVRRIEQENRDLRASKELIGLRLEPRVANRLLSVFLKDACGGGSSSSNINNNNDGITTTTSNDDDVKSSVDALVMELKAVREDNARLIAHMQLLRAGGTQSIKLQEDADLRSLYLEAIAEARVFKPTIAKLRAQISAMEFDWTQAKQLRDELFDYDDKLREHRMVEEVLMCHPPGAKRGEGVKVFATSRRQMLEILVEDRNRNINGHYTRHVIPLEQLRLEKDAEILELRKLVRMYELRSGVSTVELRTVRMPEWLEQECAAETRCRSVIAKCCAEEAKLEALQRVVKQYEDRASEWKMAHDQALGIIHRAEGMRAEYDGLMAKLKEEDQRILAKKKELNRCANRRGNGDTVNLLHARLREISEETDEAEGEIAAKELALKRLRANITAREKALHEEHQALRLLEERIKSAAHRRQQLLLHDDETEKQDKKGGYGSSAMEEDDINSRCGDDEALSFGFSAVCV